MQLVNDDYCNAADIEQSPPETRCSVGDQATRTIGGKIRRSYERS